MAKLKSINVTVENVALGDVLDKLDGMPGVIHIDLNLKSEKALVTPKEPKEAVRQANFGKSKQGVGVQEAVLKYLATNGPTHVAVLSKHIGETSNKRIYSCTYNLKQKGEVQLGEPGTYKITALGRKRLPNAVSKTTKPARGEGRNILLKALSDGTKKVAELAVALEAGGLSKNSISGRVHAAREDGIVKSDGNGTYELTAKGIKEAAALQGA
jgi:hypothetical protein